MKAKKNNFVSGQEPIKVLVVDDLERVRVALRNLLVLNEGIEVIGEAEDGYEAVQMAENLHPDVVLMDWKMPNLDGLEATKRIKDFQPEIGVVLLTIHNSDELGQRANEAGVDEFVAKGIDADVLIASIRKVHRQNLIQKK
jgi:DNA-binding NarL/FixJ family response regulator